MQKLTKIILCVCLAGALVDTSVWARGGGGHGGFGGGHFGGGGHYGGGYGGHGGYYGGIGFGVYGLGYGSGYYGGPYYGGYGGYYGYPSGAMTVPAAPPVYIQQSSPVSQALQPGYWYYCNNPQGYYPTIQDCPNGWQQVAPRAQ